MAYILTVEALWHPISTAGFDSVTWRRAVNPWEGQK